jgi:predicted 3-demethylubiquinone-9 3-methyltransferase (glyoxalase superfamily)
MAAIQRVAPCLWFDHQAEEAAKFYVSVFKNSKITNVTRYSKLDRRFTNGGPAFTFSEAISLQVNCDTQKEVDYYWEKLSNGGDAKAQQCGWLKDKYGLSWQIVPTVLPEMLKDSESPKAQRAMEAILHMKKIDIGELEHAFAGSVRLLGAAL